jgi:hypothetical protein
MFDYSQSPLPDRYGRGFSPRYRMSPENSPSVQRGRHGVHGAGTNVALSQFGDKRTRCGEVSRDVNDGGAGSAMSSGKRTASVNAFAIITCITDKLVPIERGVSETMPVTISSTAATTAFGLASWSASKRSTQ